MVQLIPPSLILKVCPPMTGAKLLVDTPVLGATVRVTWPGAVPVEGVIVTLALEDDEVHVQPAAEPETRRVSEPPADVSAALPELNANEQAGANCRML